MCPLKERVEHFITMPTSQRSYDGLFATPASPTFRFTFRNTLQQEAKLSIPPVDNLCTFIWTEGSYCSCVLTLFAVHVISWTDRDCCSPLMKQAFKITALRVKGAMFIGLAAIQYFYQHAQPWSQRLVSFLVSNGRAKAPDSV